MSVNQNCRLQKKRYRRYRKESQKSIDHREKTQRKERLDEMRKKSSEEPSAELSVEETFLQLDEILEKLESSDTTLEEAFACYEEGIRLVKTCTEKIDRVEKQMIVLRGGMEDGNE